jgi:TonB family protein
MVNKIRLHWYENMPQLLHTGMKGVVKIRFSILRNGRVTDVTLLDSSNVPPYDFAARKAIELASPFNPLPGDFPLSSERVTVIFYYNSKPPQR